MVELTQGRALTAVFWEISQQRYFWHCGEPCTRGVSALRQCRSLHKGNLRLGEHESRACTLSRKKNGEVNHKPIEGVLKIGNLNGDVSLKAGDSIRVPRALGVLPCDMAAGISGLRPARGPEMGTGA